MTRETDKYQDVDQLTDWRPEPPCPKARSTSMSPTSSAKPFRKVRFRDLGTNKIDPDHFYWVMGVRNCATESACPFRADIVAKVFFDGQASQLRRPPGPNGLEDRRMM